MKRFMLLMFCAASGLLAQFPIGEKITRENVAIVVTKCCSGIDVNNPGSVIVQPKGFMVSVYTSSPSTEEFRVTLLYRDKEGVERRSVHKFDRWPSLDGWTVELFSIGDAELIDVAVTEYRPGVTLSFANPS